MARRSQFPVARPPKAAAKKTRAPKRLQTHVFLNSGQTTHDLVPICDRPECGQPRTHRVHDLYQVVDEDVAEVEARRVGEAGDG